MNNLLLVVGSDPSVYVSDVFEMEVVVPRGESALNSNSTSTALRADYWIILDHIVVVVVLGGGGWIVELSSNRHMRCDVRTTETKRIKKSFLMLWV